MSTTTTVRDVVRSVVARVEPAELPLLDGLAEFDDETVVRRLSGRAGREPLGFGLGEILALVTPVVWLVLNEIAQRAAGAAVDGTAKGAKRLLRRLTGRRSQQVVLPALTADEVAEVRRRLRELAAAHELDDALTEEIVTAVLDHIDRRPPDEREDDGGGAAR
ncbi:hypothetical protein [Lentzea fradiae]|nr:hypothetical protein [Lentzea fradiae]